MAALWHIRQSGGVATGLYIYILIQLARYASSHLPQAQNIHNVLYFLGWGVGAGRWQVRIQDFCRGWAWFWRHCAFRVASVRKIWAKILVERGFGWGDLDQRLGGEVMKGAIVTGFFFPKDFSFPPSPPPPVSSSLRSPPPLSVIGTTAARGTQSRPELPSYYIISLLYYLHVVLFIHNVHVDLYIVSDLLMKKNVTKFSPSGIEFPLAFVTIDLCIWFWIE